jgi:prepilin-type N-terminal cleavage/methylation domain-containing protein
MPADNHTRSLLRPRRREGFSLVELLVAMSVFLVVIAAIFGVWNRLQSTYDFTGQDLLAQEQARAAMAEMVEFIRTARAPEDAPSETLNAAIVAADANQIVLWADTDRDSGHELELIRFRVDSTTGILYRDTASESYTFPGASVRLVTSNVANDSSQPLFTYSEGGGALLAAPVADPTRIREVHITLMVDVIQGSSPIPHVLTSIVQPRNLRQH